MTDKVYEKLLNIALEKAGVVGIIEGFIKDNKISCRETIYQSDRVIQNAYEFIEDLCNVVGYYKYEEDKEDEE